MEKKKHIACGLTLLSAVFTMLCLFSCKEKAPAQPEMTPRGTPLLTKDTLVYDEASQTFTLQLHADSVADAKLSFRVYDGDSLIMENADGLFHGIKPMDEGYFAELKAEWSDTTIVTPQLHLSNFVVPREPVDKLGREELEQLVNQRKVRLGDDAHFVQDVRISVVESQYFPSSLAEVSQYIDLGVWQSVQVIDITYDANNLITSFVLKPIGEILPSPDDDDLY